MVAQDRGAGRGGDRQFISLAHGPGRAAGRAGSERARARRLRQEEHHRQSELLDCAARGGAQAAARCGDHQARRGCDLSVGVGGRQGCDGRVVRPDQVGVHARRDRKQEVHQADRVQRDPAHRRLHGRRLHQGRMEDGGRDQEDPRPQDQAHRDLRARAGVRRPFRPSMSSSSALSPPRRRERLCAKRPACSWSTSASLAAT
jgi:hypothetical protein